MITNVALYLRKSRPDEENREETLARHETLLTEYCARNNLAIIKVYREVVSGENIENRPEMQKLLDEVDAGSYDGVVCVEIERLSRGNVIDQVEILEVFKSSNTKIYTLNKVYDLNNEDIDEEYFEFALFMSRREYKTIKRRMNRGKVQATKEGYYISSKLPYGYTKKRDGKGVVLIPDENQAPVIKYIFDLYTSGLGAAVIANDLNSKGIRNCSGGTWSFGGVMALIRNRVYIGEVHSTKFNTWFEGKHEAIIDRATFEKAKLLAEQRAPKVHKYNTLKNPLAGLCYCAKCGGGLTRNHAPSNNADYMACRRYECEGVKAIHLDIVEEQIIEKLKEELKGFNYFLENDKNKKEKLKQERKIKLLEKELKQKEKQLDHACELLETGVYTVDIFVSRTDKLKAEIKEIKETLSAPIVDEEKRITTAIPILEKVLELYPTLETKEKNRLLKTIIKRVDVNDGYKITVTLLI